MGIGLCVLMCTLIHVFSLHAFSFLPFLPLSVRVCVCVCVRARILLYVSLCIALPLTRSHSLTLAFSPFLPASVSPCMCVCVCVRAHHSRFLSAQVMDKRDRRQRGAGLHVHSRHAITRLDASSAALSESAPQSARV